MTAPLPALIRPATAGDIAAVRDLLVTTWHDTYDVFYGADEVTRITDQWHSVEALTRQLETAGLVFLVAEAADGRLAGTALAGFESEALVQLHRLHVAPAAQSRGVGSRLVAAVVARFPQAAAMRLYVEPRNTRAIRFYEAGGFAKVSQVSDCGMPGSGLAALVMERRLGA
jgi:ribosomal protein S18 acetylase RimI-like enzyme